MSSEALPGQPPPAPPGKPDAGSNGDKLLTAEDVAELLGGDIQPAWVYAEARAGRIPKVPIGRRVRFRRSSILDWLEQLEQGPTR